MTACNNETGRGGGERCKTGLWGSVQNFDHSPTILLSSFAYGYILCWPIGQARLRASIHRVDPRWAAIKEELLQVTVWVGLR